MKRENIPTLPEYHKVDPEVFKQLIRAYTTFPEGALVDYDSVTDMLLSDTAPSFDRYCLIAAYALMAARTLSVSSKGGFNCYQNTPTQL